MSSHPSLLRFSSSYCDWEQLGDIILSQIAENVEFMFSADGFGSREEIPPMFIAHGYLRVSDEEN